MTEATSGRTPCGHRFCKDCLFRIRTATAAQTCPMCRASLAPRQQPAPVPAAAPVATQRPVSLEVAQAILANEQQRVEHQQLKIRELLPHLQLRHLPVGGVVSLETLRQRIQG